MGEVMQKDGARAEFAPDWPGLSDGPEAKREEQEAQTAEEQRRDDMRMVLGTIQGRRAVYEILDGCGTFSSVHGDRQAGAHEAGVSIVVRVKDAGLKYWHKMLEENET